MIIRDEQRKAFKPLIEEALIAVIYDYLRNYPHPAFAALGKEAFLRAIEEGIKRGRMYGLTWQASLCAFVGLTILIASKFDLYPSIQKILLDERIEPDERLITLVNQLPKGDWEPASSFVQSGSDHQENPAMSISRQRQNNRELLLKLKWICSQIDLERFANRFRSGL
jgi:hypothetical protein